MIEVRPFATLGGGDHGWLKTKHHFSFADYHDDGRMHWGALRVWNDDEIAAGNGFPPHPHQEMEIITYVRAGAITHEDSLGNRGRTEAGDVQVMSAGTGIRHAEYNQEKETTTLFQIWIMPHQRGGQPSWGSRPFPKQDRAGKFVTLASGFSEDEAAGALLIRADGRVAGATIAAGQETTWTVTPGRKVYLVPARGSVLVNGVAVGPRDEAAVQDETSLHIEAKDDAEVVLVETAD